MRSCARLSHHLGVFMLLSSLHLPKILSQCDSDYFRSRRAWCNRIPIALHAVRNSNAMAGSPQMRVNTSFTLDTTVYTVTMTSFSGLLLPGVHYHSAPKSVKWTWTHLAALATWAPLQELCKWVWMFEFAHHWGPQSSSGFCKLH